MVSGDANAAAGQMNLQRFVNFFGWCLSDGLYLHRLIGLILAQRTVIDHHEFGGQFFRGVALVAHHNQTRLAVYGNGINSFNSFSVWRLELRFLRLLFLEGCVLGVGSVV